MGFLTILKSPGTWAVHSNGPSLIGNTPQTHTPQAVLTRQQKQDVNDKNEVTDALDCVLLYWAIELNVNSGSVVPDPFIEFRLLRNSVTTQATIQFDAQETGIKAQILNIPYSFNEHFNFEIQQFGSGNTFYSWCFAGKMSAPSLP